MLPSILVIEDDTTLVKSIRTYLKRHEFDVRSAGSGVEGLHGFERFKPDIVLLDLNLLDLNGIDVLTLLRKHDARLKVIMMTDGGNIQIAVNAMKAGAHGYLTKPIVLEELKLLLEKAAEQQRKEGTLSYYQRREAVESGLIRLLGRSPAMQSLKQKIRRLLQAEQQLTDAPPASVLISGETGTGKELVARALHFDSPRRAQPFVKLNCGTIPANLLEAELFGYEKGAFTDARERKPGLMETADGGTLFLDEIGNLEPAAQVKVLNLLENRVVRRLGGTRDLRLDVRVISATKFPLEQAVRENRFRSDLLFRLQGLQLELPPLRKRGEDILLLAEAFLADQGRRYHKEGLRFSAAAKEMLLIYFWPGNVRELRNCVDLAVLLAKEPTMEPDSLRLCSQLAGMPGCNVADPTTSPFSLPSAGLDLEVLEFQLMDQALERTRGNVTKAAKLLGLSRDTLRYRMDKHSTEPIL